MWAWVCAAAAVGNALLFMLETDRDLAECCSGGFRAADGVTGGILAIDWALRLSSCVADVRFGRLGGLWGRVAFALTRLSLLDALAAVPVLLSLLVPHPEAEVFEDNPWAPWLWVGALRVLSLLKLERYSRSYAALVRVVYSKRGQLWASLVAALAALAVSATALYLAELHSPKPLRSVIEAGYLAFITLTTVSPVLRRRRLRRRPHHPARPASRTCGLAEQRPSLRLKAAAAHSGSESMKASKPLAPLSMVCCRRWGTETTPRTPLWPGCSLAPQRCAALASSPSPPA